MSPNYAKLYDLLNDFGVGVYPDVVPESATLPAISYVHIAQSAGRLKDGNKSGYSDTWRLSLLAENIKDLQTLIGVVMALDNTNNSDYQRIFVVFNTTEAKMPEETFRRAIVDIQTYERIY